MSKSLLLVDSSTPFVYLGLFNIQDELTSQPIKWSKKNELIFSLYRKQILYPVQESKENSKSVNACKNSLRDHFIGNHTSTLLGTSTPTSSAQVPRQARHKYLDRLGTSTPTGSVTVTLANTGGDGWLMGLIKEMLIRENLKKTDYLGLGKGPGLFTPLRISHVTFRTLSLLWGNKKENTPVMHFSSLEFWHAFFSLKTSEILMIRENRNLYYVYMPKENPCFLAITWQDWLDRIKNVCIRRADEKESPKIYLWEEVWRGQSREVQEIHEMQEIQKNEISKIPGYQLEHISVSSALESFKGIDFIPEFVTKPNVQSKIIPIEKLLPEYGHKTI